VHDADLRQSRLSCRQAERFGTDVSAVGLPARNLQLWRKCRGQIRHQAAEMTVLATRTQAGVLALGADNDVRIAFSDNTIEEFDLHAVEVRRLRYDAQERGLFVRHAHALAPFPSRLILLTRTGSWHQA
jgi:hypothetical protein